MQCAIPQAAAMPITAQPLTVLHICRSIFPKFVLLSEHVYRHIMVQVCMHVRLCVGKVIIVHFTLLVHTFFCASSDSDRKGSALDGSLYLEFYN